MTQTEKQTRSSKILHSFEGNLPVLKFGSHLKLEQKTFFESIAIDARTAHLLTPSKCVRFNPMEVIKMTTASITIVVCVRWEHESRSPLSEPVSNAVMDASHVIALFALNLT